MNNPSEPLPEDRKPPTKMEILEKFKDCITGGEIMISERYYPPSHDELIAEAAQLTYLGEIGGWFVWIKHGRSGESEDVSTILVALNGLDRDALATERHHLDGLFMVRVNFHLVVNALLINAGIAAIENPWAVGILGVACIFWAFMFIPPNVRIWLKLNHLHRNIPNHERITVPDSESILYNYATKVFFKRWKSDFNESENRLKWHDAGNLYTWGVFGFVTLVWLALWLYSIC